ncbi:MAG: DUF3365 domain-containing protein [Deltaproteobacteria bacterium]|nr:DUF3365 domain-containing protein [Deltaproteobacteria bacterium]
MKRLPTRQSLLHLAAAVLVAGLAACDSKPSGGPAESTGISPSKMADALFAVMAADRTVYSNQVVYRLQDVEEVIKASEHWDNQKALPLPAQMFRMSAGLVAKQTDAFSYALLSKWPLNKENAPKTEVEVAGLDSVAENPSKPFYGRETMGDVEYFTAVYADVAVSPSCVTCHNAHEDSPRNDFKAGDVMGGVVIRIPLR